MIFWLILVLAFVLYYILIKPHRFWKDKGVRQGKPWILLGDTWGTMFGLMDVAQSIKHFYDKFPGVRYYGIYQFLKPKFVVKDPELIKRITVKDFDHFVDHVAMVDPEADPLFAKNLLNLRGDDWRNMRSTLSGSFTSSKMKAMFALMTDAAENFVKYFKKQNEDLLEVELKDAFTRFTIDVIATTSFGVQVNSLEEKKNEFFLMGKEITHLSFFFFLKLLVFWFSPSLFKRFKFRMFRKAVTDFFTRVITDTIRTREAKGIYRPDMLQILIEAKKGAEKEETNIGEVGFAATKEFIPAKSKITKELTDEDITAQAVIFFFAGFDSVSSAMTFATYELATHPDVQERLRQEIQETLNASNGKVTFEALTSMKYMDMVLSADLMSSSKSMPGH
ncbi:cytochrome P450 9e2-like isoform X2 [Cylas formicarius]|uniref:cytochrome P450 9e2-like isoform X2 n=1 Tax=Cylas formicarius TaxID=197179 RepID=UPI0029587117|nr:cytochrome P450 9e2-like isoform X2 [Cylas formicarius]